MGSREGKDWIMEGERSGKEKRGGKREWDWREREGGKREEGSCCTTFW
jgi:hypothetical protein